MKVISNKEYYSKIEKVRQNAKDSLMSELVKNITSTIPKKADALSMIIAEQLERTQRKISHWRSYVELAEDIDNPDREPLMGYFKDFVDDYQLFAVMQSRINKSISGTFHIYDEKGEVDIDETRKFIDSQGYPLPWFRDFMRYAMHAVFYGWEAIQLGDVINDTFSYVEKIPEENQIPYYDSMVKNVNYPFLVDSDNTIDFTREPVNTWVIRTGSRTDLGLINKCAPYIIYKSIFGNWSQHASVFGMPLTHLKTQLSDNKRKQNALEQLRDRSGSTTILTDFLDELNIIEQKGGGDPHQIYGSFIDKCDSAISKIVLSQTGTTDEKAFAGSAKVHGETEDSIIFSDKLDIKAVVNEKLIPRMKRIGIIAPDKKIHGGWDHSEKMSIADWASVFLNLSQAGHVVTAQEVMKRTGVEIDETIVALPDNKTFSVMNKINKLYGKNNS